MKKDDDILALTVYSIDEKKYGKIKGINSSNCNY